MNDAARPGERPPQADQLEQLAGQSQPGIVREFLQFLAHEKKWWLLPIVLVLLLLGLIVVVAGTAVGPFIYPFF